MKNIVVLTDFSDNAWNALFTVLKLYEKVETSFLITHCFEPSIGGILGDKSKERLAVIYESLSTDSNMHLKGILDYLEKHHHNPNHQFKTISVADDLVDTIKKMLNENDIDLIALGARGATGAKDVFMGSNAVKVIKKIKQCAILAVPEDHDFKSLKKIVFPTDFSHRIKTEELEILKDLAELWESQIVLFQVSMESKLGEEQTQHKKALENELEELNYTYLTAEMKINIKSAINSIVEDSKADMIALINYSHTFLERLTREPVVKRMAFNAKVPLLVLPARGS